MAATGCTDSSTYCSYVNGVCSSNVCSYGCSVTYLVDYPCYYPPYQYSYSEVSCDCANKVCDASIGCVECTSASHCREKCDATTYVIYWNGYCKADNTCGYSSSYDCDNSNGCGSGDKSNYYLYYGCTVTAGTARCVVASEDSCADCSCSCGGYNVVETTANGNCNDGKDNDCDGTTDSADSGCCVCTSGACCDGCQYRSSTYICNSAYATDYGCPDGTACGNDVKVRYKTRSCSGTSSSCDGTISSDWGSWSLAADCSASQYCVDDVSTCQSQCSSGACCDGCQYRSSTSNALAPLIVVQPLTKVMIMEIV
ncbi:MAG: hypothetical protein HZC29_05675 [Thaumarchaeota archaeon]|nr:hypothetical protein [Nitrososphaerota archaeon]